MNLAEAFKLHLEMKLRTLLRKHFSCYVKLSQASIESNSTKDLWEEMKLIDKKIKEIKKELEVYEDF